LRLLAVFGSVVVLAACSSGFTVAEPQTNQNEEATGTCPANIESANGEKCIPNGLECRIPIVCDAVNEQATCTCVRGTFACRDQLGVIPKGTEPVCTPRAPADDSPCPPTMDVADGLTCETVGKLCTYEGPICPESLTGKPALESCVCRGARDGGKRYTCYPIKCIGN
jgi:hypothetical protein